MAMQYARNEISHNLTIQADALFQHTILPSYSLEWPSVAELMVRTGARIGGSTALACLMGMQWANGLDVFVPSEHARATWEGFLLASGWMHKPRRETSITTAVSVTEVGVRVAHPRFRTCLDSIYTFTNTTNLIVKNIKIYVCDIDEFTSSVDLACCTAMLRVRVTGPGEHMTIWTCSQEEEMLSRKVTFIKATTLTPHEHQTRIEKYRARGFLVIDREAALPLPPRSPLLRSGPPPSSVANSPLMTGPPPPFVPQLFRL
jgi:hypothetical protein